MDDFPVAKPTRDPTLFSSQEILRGPTVVIPQHRAQLTPRERLLGIEHSSRQHKRAKVEEAESSSASVVGVVPDTLPKVGKSKVKRITPQEYLSRERTRAPAPLDQLQLQLAHLQSAMKDMKAHMSSGSDSKKSLQGSRRRMVLGVAPLLRRHPCRIPPGVLHRWSQPVHLS
jgi:hypothetical protein